MELHIWQLDNGSFHSTPKLKVPENIILLFQPSHCPELNPIERLWEYLKGFLSWDLFSNLNDLKAKVTEILNSLSEEVIASVTDGNILSLRYLEWVCELTTGG